MGDAPEARRIVVDGEELFAISGTDLARFMAIRRQVGGQSDRIRALMSSVARLTETLDVLGPLFAELAGVHVCEGAGCRLCALVADGLGQVETARRALPRSGRARSAAPRRPPGDHPPPGSARHPGDPPPPGGD
ncbi:hypothetical protein ACIGEZ_20035 [Streptomyces sp. NPDC085481]|uniref:hypothetical protein n=1 Tax=Streptomyces sp. NPDC085481 TaxID=3365727 RepID=UPI0037D23C23